MQEKNYAHPRRNFFIDKKFQSRFILKFCLLIVGACLIFGGIIYLFSQKTATTAFENSRLIIKSTADYLLPLMSLTFIITVIVIGLATIMVTLFISHKIAGPSYRFKKIAEAVASGDLTLKAKIRSSDQLQPVAVGLAEMVKELRDQILKIRETLSVLKETTAKLRELKDEDSKKQLSDLENKINELEKEINYFKI